MAKYLYPAVFAKEGTQYSVHFPDLESCYTMGDSLQDAYEMASDALCMTLYTMEEELKEIPAPSATSDIKTQEGEFVTLVSCDTMEYRVFYNNKSVKKTLTIPEWLNTMSEHAGINFSAVLQAALKQELHLADG